MHSVKATWSGRTFALAKSNESGGKKSRNRIPKDERKTLVESFIKRHQRLNNGNFPSLSLTHREVGGSFYTVREIFREIIQENRVLGPAELTFEEKSTDQEQKQSQSSSILMGPVAPLSLPPKGISLELDHKNCMQEKLVVVPNNCSSDAELVKTLRNGENINVESLKDRGSHILVQGESEASKLLVETAASDIRESVESLNGTFSLKHEVRILENGKDVHGIHYDTEDVKRICNESKPTEPIEVDKRVKDAAAEMTKRMNITGSVSAAVTATIDMSASMAVETFPLSDSCNQECSELENSNKAGGGIVTEGMDAKDIVVVDALHSKVNETRESSNGTTEHNLPISSDESGKAEDNGTETDGMSNFTGNKEAVVKETTMEEGKVEANPDSRAQKGSMATSNRIKPESWKDGSNSIRGGEANPFMAILKSFITAFVKFWSE